MPSIAKLKAERSQLLKEAAFQQVLERKQMKLEEEQKKVKADIARLKLQTSKTRRRLRKGLFAVKSGSEEGREKVKKFVQDPRTRKAARLTFEFLFGKGKKSGRK